MNDPIYDVSEFTERLLDEEYSTDWYNEVPVSGFRFKPDGMSLAFNFGRGATVEANPKTPRVLEGILERLQIEGVGLRRLDSENLSDVLNKVAEKATGEATIAVKHGAVVACLSSGDTGNDFRHLTSSEVFDKTMQSIHTLCRGEEDDFKGTIEDKYVTADFVLPLQKMIGGITYKVGVKMNTSDFGRSAVHYLATLRYGGVKMPVFERAIRHRDNNAMDEIEECLTMLEKSVEDGSVRLEALKSITINNPAGAMRRIGKKFKLPKKDVVPVIASYESAGNGPCSAFHVYELLCEGLGKYEMKAKAEYYRHYSSIMLSLIGINWEDYDLPGSFSW